MKHWNVPYNIVWVKSMQVRHQLAPSQHWQDRLTVLSFLHNHIFYQESFQSKLIIGYHLSQLMQTTMYLLSIIFKLRSVYLDSLPLTGDDIETSSTLPPRPLSHVFVSRDVSLSLSPTGRSLTWNWQYILLRHNSDMLTLHPQAMAWWHVFNALFIKRRQANMLFWGAGSEWLTLWPLANTAQVRFPIPARQMSLGQ